MANFWSKGVKDETRLRTNQIDLLAICDLVLIMAAIDTMFFLNLTFLFINRLINQSVSQF